MTPRWSIVAIVAGTLLVTVACVGYVALAGVPDPTAGVQLGSTPATRAGLVSGLVLLAVGVWLPWQVRRGVRRRRPAGRRPRVGRGDSRGQVASPAHGGSGGATTQTLHLPPSPAVWVRRGGHRAGRLPLPAPAGPQLPQRNGACGSVPAAVRLAQAAGATPDDRRWRARGAARRQVAVDVWEPSTATVPDPGCGGRSPRLSQPGWAHVVALLPVVVAVPREPQMWTARGGAQTATGLEIDQH